MRDRQARGKDPYQSGDGSDDGDFSDGESRTGGKLRLGNVRYVIALSLRDATALSHTCIRLPYSSFPPQHVVLCSLTTLLPDQDSVERDEFAKFERRHKAIAFLDSPELLLMYAQSTGDVSLPASRVSTPARWHTNHPCRASPVPVFISPEYSAATTTRRRNIPTDTPPTRTLVGATTSTRQTRGAEPSITPPAPIDSPLGQRKHISTAAS